MIKITGTEISTTYKLLNVNITIDRLIILICSYDLLNKSKSWLMYVNEKKM